MLADGDTLLRAEGTLTPVTEDQALDLAAAKKSAVIGLIPFAPDAPAFLAVPDALVREHRPPQAGSWQAPAPSKVMGRDNPAYRQAVADAVARMNRGELDKVVLSRLLELSYDEPLNLQGLYETLRAQQPRATVFSAQLPGGSYLMGASPELVLEANQTGFRTVPLAGSAARTEEAGSTDDAQIGEALMRSAKDRAEHATVVQDIQGRLAPLTTSMTVPPVPSLISTPQLWHLASPITGQLRAGVHALQAARAIHPTPAICGTPTDRALDLISDLEPFDRGFFGGLVGYMDATGAGRWYLVLRCAEVTDQHATLFAGAGIVKESTPVGEHAETATKLGTFGRALNLSF